MMQEMKVQDGKAPSSDKKKSGGTGVALLFLTEFFLPR